MLSCNNTWQEVLEKNCSLAIIPIGSMEQHGPHLPLATDAIIADAVAKKVGEKLGAFVLPCLPYSCSQEHSDFPGTVWFSPSTLASVLKDMVLALYEHDFLDIAIINQHGGNHIIKPVVLELNKNLPKLRLTAHKATPMTKAVQDILSSRREEEIHAGELETSLLEVLAPALVKSEKAVNFVPLESYDYLEYLRMRKISSSGIWGNAGLASGVKGEQLLEVIVDEVSSSVKNTISRLKAGH